MKRFVCTLAFVLMASLPCAAADMGGQAILGARDILHGRFVEEKHLEGFKGPMHSEGRFTVAPQHGLIWDMEKPFPTTTVITPAGLAQNIKGITVAHMPAKKMPFLLHLYEMLNGALTGNWQALENDFAVTRNGGDQNWQVILTPKQRDNPAMPFTSITISGRRYVDNVVLMKADGDNDTLTFLDEAVATSTTAAENAAFRSVGP